MNKQKKLTVIITSGGTISEIDDIRHIGNFSGGTTACLMAEEFLRQGATVNYVYGKNAKQPFRSNMSADPRKKWNSEKNRISKAVKNWQNYSSQLIEHPFLTFEDYFQIVKKLCLKKQSDVIILAAAVSDYGAEKIIGKISSNQEELNIRLKKNPKIISLVKKWQPRIFLVGFKLLSDVSMEKLIETAYSHGLNNRSDLTLANVVNNGKFSNRQNVFITPEKGLIACKTEDLPKKIADLVFYRVSKQHYQTKLNKASNLPKNNDSQIKKLHQAVKGLWDLNLFPPYSPSADRHFGFVALRTHEKSFLVTARGSNKEYLSENDIVIVKSINFEEKIINAVSLGKKASLNANIAGRIFRDRPDVNLIVHSHIHPHIDNVTKTAYSPGTKEDEEEIIKYLSNNETIVELKNHGVIILGKNLSDIIGQLLSLKPAYKNFPKVYDMVYARFQKDDNFLKLIQDNVKPKADILELAAGTCRLTEALIGSDYHNIVVMDQSKPMLDAAAKRMGAKFDNLESHVGNFLELDLEKKFDAILIRQAVNYVQNKANMLKLFKIIKKHLKPSGKLIFNAPNYYHGMDYAKRKWTESQKDWLVSTEESNQIFGRSLTHSQRSILIKQGESQIEQFYDINRFGLFTAIEFSDTLKMAGFKKVKLFGKNLVRLSANSGSVYVIASP